MHIEAHPKYGFWRTLKITPTRPRLHSRLRYRLGSGSLPRFLERKVLVRPPFSHRPGPARAMRERLIIVRVNGGIGCARCYERGSTRPNGISPDALCVPPAERKSFLSRTRRTRGDQIVPIVQPRPERVGNYGLWLNADSRPKVPWTMHYAAPCTMRHSWESRKQEADQDHSKVYDNLTWDLTSFDLTWLDLHSVSRGFHVFLACLISVRYVTWKKSVCARARDVYPYSGTTLPENSLQLLFPKHFAATRGEEATSRPSSEY